MDQLSYLRMRPSRRPGSTLWKCFLNVRAALGTGDTWSPVQEMFPGPNETEPPPPWFRYNRSVVAKILFFSVEPTCHYTIVCV